MDVFYTNNGGDYGDPLFKNYISVVSITALPYLWATKPCQLRSMLPVSIVRFSMSEHTYYANSWFPAITNSGLVWVCVFIIIALELTAGVLLFLGTLALFKARRSDSASFNQAKSLSLLGAGIGIIVWFGFFGVLGGAWFQLWQTSVGAQSLGGAFQYFASCVFIWVIVRADD